MRGDKECPFSGVTNFGRVWRKSPESDVRIERLTGWHVGDSSALEAVASFLPFYLKLLLVLFLFCFCFFVSFHMSDNY